MTYKQAIKLYLKHTIPAEETIKRLMLWDPKLTMSANGKKMGLTYQQSFERLWYLMVRFNLKCRLTGKGNYERKPITKKSKKSHSR
jgi:hypothetical protein